MRATADIGWWRSGNKQDGPFELGLLWPGLMRQYGAVLGLPFGVEGIFFFLGAIFAGIYLWGWRRLPGWGHWWSGGQSRSAASWGRYRWSRSTRG